jgi:hypothetical protein
MEETNIITWELWKKVLVSSMKNDNINKYRYLLIKLIYRVDMLKLI